MKPRRAGAGTVFALLWLALGTHLPIGAAPPPVKTEPRDAKQAYEIAVIDKSMTREWKDERAFQKFIREKFGTLQIRRFRFNSQELLDWLDQEPQPLPRILCLVDGWRTPEIERVDLRGSKNGKPLRETFNVQDHQWRDALVRAKSFADAR